MSKIIRVLPTARRRLDTRDTGGMSPPSALRPVNVQEYNMKVIIAGSRTITDARLVEEAIRLSGFHITEVVSGKAPNGVDGLGEAWATRNQIPVAQFPADWDTYGKAAGPIRNAQMAKYADALICVWDGVSPGSNNMIRTARSAGLPVFETVV